MHLGALADGLGSFPLDYEACPPQSVSRDSRNGIRSLIRIGRMVVPLFDSDLYLRYVVVSRLYLDIFRGEPDISEFDKTFTPIRSSSPIFSTIVGSDLHEILLSLHPVLG